VVVVAVAVVRVELAVELAHIEERLSFAPLEKKK
jgi:hypothetical protein